MNGVATEATDNPIVDHATNLPRPAISLRLAPQSPEAEAYRTLAVNLQFAYPDHPLQVILVTSPGAGDGKSTAVASLATAWADAGRTVLAVDADLRRPGLHRIFGCANQAGLTNALRDPEGSLAITETDNARLRLMTAGPQPANAAEALASDRFAYVMDRLRDEAELLILDCAPAAVFADAALVSARADGVLLVIGAGKTNRDQARLARENLERVHANVLGAVLVGTRADRKLYAY